MARVSDAALAIGLRGDLAHANARAIFYKGSRVRGDPDFLLARALQRVTLAVFVVPAIRLRERARLRFARLRSRRRAGSAAKCERGHERTGERERDDRRDR